MSGLFSSSRRKEAKAYADDLNKQLKNGARQGSHQLQNLRDTASDQVQRLGSHFEDGRRQAQEFTKRSAKTIHHQAQDNPWAYVAAGTVLGIAIGYFIGRR